MLHRDSSQSLLPKRRSRVNTEVQRDSNPLRTPQQLLRERPLLHHNHTAQHDSGTNHNITTLSDQPSQQKLEDTVTK